MLIEKLTAIVGDANVLTGEQVRSRAVGWADRGPCQAKAIVRPGSTDEVSRVLAECHASGQPVVLFGGLTGLVRAASPASTRSRFRSSACTASNRSIRSAAR